MLSFVQKYPHEIAAIDQRGKVRFDEADELLGGGAGSRRDRFRHLEKAADALQAEDIAAVRSRKREDLTAEIEEGAMSCVLMHLANVSYRVGRTLHWDEKTWTVKNDPEANEMLTREYRAPYIVPAKV